MFQAFGETSLNEVLARRLTTPGGTSAPAVAPEIFPVLVLENDRPEWKFLGGERLAATEGTTVAAVAASRSQFHFRIPRGVQSIAVIEHLEVTLGANDNVIVNRTRVDNGNLANVLATGSRDLRIVDNELVTNHTMLQVSAEATAAPILNATSLFRRIGCAAGVREIIPGPFIIGPGCTLIVGAQSDNVSVSCSAQWRERRAEPGELG